MGIDRPVASVTGQDEWEWNRWQAALQSDDDPTGTAEANSSGERGVRTTERTDRQRRVRALEVELARRERSLQDVIDHYERLLEQKNRRIADLESEASNRSWRASMASKRRRFGSQF